MANTYNLEPQPTAKVVLHTTTGDLCLELFAQQTPLASRNFLQLCLDGYYDNTIFHRLVPGFILQGGDPTGTGSGGASSFDNGKPFADEFHSRLKFNRRGLLGMANTGVRNDNASQFFLTLGKTQELDNRNTMFGRVEAGNTIYNLVKMGEAELTADEGSDRPMYPTRITGAEILVNPFDGMTRRVREAARQVEAPDTKAKKPKKKGGKQMLSFGGGGGDDDEDGERAPAVRSKLANPSFIDAQASKAKKRPAAEAVSATTAAASPPPSKKQRAPSPLAAPAIRSKPVAKRAASRKLRSPSPESDEDADDDNNTTTTAAAAALAKTTAQIAQLKASLRRDVPAAAPAASASATTSGLAALVPPTAMRGRKRRGPGSSTAVSAVPSKDEQKSLDALQAFRKRLAASSAGSPPPSSLSSSTSKRGPAAAVAAGATVNDDDDEDDDGEDGDQEDDKKAGNDGHVRRNGHPKAASAAAPSTEVDPDARLCELHFVPDCASCSKWDQRGRQGHGRNRDRGADEGDKKGKDDGDDGDGDDSDSDSDSDGDDENWMSHRLTFERDRRGKDLEWKRQNERILEVFEPQARAAEFRQEAARNGKKARGR